MLSSRTSLKYDIDPFRHDPVDPHTSSNGTSGQFGAVAEVSDAQALLVLSTQRGPVLNWTRAAGLAPEATSEVRQPYSISVRWPARSYPVREWLLPRA
jgi:hypothetical protein